MKTLTLIVLSVLIIIMFVVQILAILDGYLHIWWMLLWGELIGFIFGIIVKPRSWGWKVAMSVQGIVVYGLAARVFFGRVDILDANNGTLLLASYLTVFYWLQLLPPRRVQPTY